MTVADVYSHRSGLPDHAGDKLEDLGYDRRQTLERLRYLPLAPFRISYAYTNYGITAGAEAVAAAAGKSWEDLSDEALYRPLNMTSTSSRFADFLARPNHAVNHVKVADKWESRFQRDPDPQSPAGGVSSSVNDMARWLMMLLGNGTHDGRRIAAPEDLLPAISPQTVSTPATTPKARTGFYGYGFNASVDSSGRTEYSHSGAFALGAATNFVVMPSEDVGIIALTNGAPYGIPETLTAEFMDLVQYGQIREDWGPLYQKAIGWLNNPVGSLVGKQPPPNPAPAKPLRDYAGVYASDYWGPAVVTEHDGALHLAMGPKNHTVALTHWDGDTFTFPLTDENAPPGTISKAVFSNDTLNLEYYDTEKLGPSPDELLTDHRPDRRRGGAAGRRRPEQRRAETGDAQHHRYRAGERVHPDQRDPGSVAADRAGDRLADQRDVRTVDHRQQRRRHGPGDPGQADAGQARDRGSGETRGAQAIRDACGPARGGGARRHHRARARRSGRRRRRDHRRGEPGGRRVTADR
ncbi:beta-lactamase family protein [Mycobacterium intracellulare 1956]|uniref:Beta-lactamase family protein n=1 Tax=Mycobacterium intracellulare 1956 TaxID=1299331 RepID=X8CMI5_MYCIT|nr:beta-lactamase family protein [Mycobacterium intracellulare 1956]